MNVTNTYMYFKTSLQNKTLLQSTIFFFKIRWPFLTNKHITSERPSWQKFNILLFTTRHKNIQKNTPSSNWFNPLLIKWCINLPNKCKEAGYQSVRNIIPLSNFCTIQHHTHSTTNYEKINNASLDEMALSLSKLYESNKSILGGIHWD